MPYEETVANDKTEFMEQLFQNEYTKMLRYAKVILERYGARTVSVTGRAEDIVQDVFCLAWQKWDEVMSSPSPAGWLYKALVFKAREALREDKTWAKRLALIPREGCLTEMDEPSEWEKAISKEDFDLLRKLYIEGYSYKELCDELDVKKSTLAMRVSRAKEKIQKYYENE